MQSRTYRHFISTGDRPPAGKRRRGRGAARGCAGRAAVPTAPCPGSLRQHRHQGSRKSRERLPMTGLRSKPPPVLPPWYLVHAAHRVSPPMGLQQGNRAPSPPAGPRTKISRGWGGWGGEGAEDEHSLTPSAPGLYHTLTLTAAGLSWSTPERAALGAGLGSGDSGCYLGV